MMKQSDACVPTNTTTEQTGREAIVVCSILISISRGLLAFAEDTTGLRFISPVRFKSLPQMSFKSSIRLITFCVIMIGFCGCAPLPTQPSAQSHVNYEGLEQVDARGVDIAFVRPGVDFSSYTGLLVEEPELAFRTPDRSRQQFPLMQDQKTRFRDLLAQQFRVELARSKQLRLVEEPAPEVLTLKVRVQDILATVRPNSFGSVGKANIFLEAIGEATIVLELRDSQSEETLARAADTRVVEGAAALQEGGDALTKWSEVEALCERWASIVRDRLDTLVEGR